MANNQTTQDIIQSQSIQSLIYTVRGKQVMLDSDLAELYSVETKRLNEQVRRNLERFPESYRFQLSQSEYDDLKSQFATSSEGSLRSQNVTLESQRGRHRKYLPYVFTEQGVAMLSAVLKSDTAIKASIRIIDAFVAMRHYIAENGGLLQRVDSLEKRQITQEIRTTERFEKVFDALGQNSLTAPQGVFFDGQVFDAYVFINDLIRQAKQSIVLIDNYVDDTVLMQLAKRSDSVRAIILTQTISRELKQDLKQHNAQYPPIEIKQFSRSHDRFLIIDGEVVYVLGASLKDMGKRWFGFMKMEKDGLVVMDRIDQILGELE